MTATDCPAIESLPDEDRAAFDAALVVVAFQATTARSYPVMLKLADRAMRHVQVDNNGKSLHLVAFGPHAAGARDAISLLELVRSLAGTQTYAKGRLQRNAIQVAEVLGCFANAEACVDPKAWCHVVTRAPTGRARHVGNFSVSISLAGRGDVDPLWIFPCRFLLDRGFSVEPLHPSTTHAQIDAGGIRAGCNWCPRFAADAVIEP